MDDLEIARTIEARFAADPDRARTIANDPRATIDPHRHASARGRAALQELVTLAGSLDGKVAIHRTLGEGGMGIVHLATQSTLGRHVAVKTLRDRPGDLDATLRVLREAWVTGALEHPNIVPVYDVGVDASGAPIIVMKRIEGESWADLVRSPEAIAARFSADDPVEWNVRILASVCNAVHFAHSRGILHRDLKPENVMIGEFGEVYVLDWGIAISLRDDPSGRLPPASLATDIAGTPAYMAPEMLLGDPSALSERTDVYLLGAIFYEIFSGAPPHVGDNLQAMIASILLSSPRFDPDFPDEARLICAKALSRDPDERYESAEAFRVALDEYLRHRGSWKLARDAEQSLAGLVHALENEPPGEERTLAIFNLLGECRFGYRAALRAWPENDAARRGLDRAVLAVIGHEVTEGDPNAAASLLREVSAPPDDVVKRVDAAVRARMEQDERLRRLEGDLDPTVGTRTRTFIGTIFGVLWTATPLVGWWHEMNGGTPSYRATMVLAFAFLALGGFFYVWAHETMTKTLLNRRLGQTLGWHLVAQVVLAAGAWRAGVSAEHDQLLHVFAWCLTETLLAVWVERWFAVPAAAAAIVFLAAAGRPRLLYPLMSLDNLVFTAVLIRIWFPRADAERMRERRRALRRRARRWLDRASGDVEQEAAD